MQKANQRCRGWFKRPVPSETKQMSNSKETPTTANKGESLLPEKNGPAPPPYCDFRTSTRAPIISVVAGNITLTTLAVRQAAICVPAAEIHHIASAISIMVNAIAAVPITPPGAVPNCQRLHL